MEAATPTVPAEVPPEEPVYFGFWDDMRPSRLGRPFFALAPMYDVTDHTWRRFTAKVGRPDVLFTEFVSIHGIANPIGFEALKPMLRFDESQRPIVAQIWGNDPAKFGTAIETILEMGFDGIDINFGCPEKGVVKSGCGGGAMQERLREKSIASVKACLAAAKGRVPISVKTRAGWAAPGDEVGISWLNDLLQLPIAALTIHCRAVGWPSSVPADWNVVAQAFRAGRIVNKHGTLICANGDAGGVANGIARVLDSAGPTVNGSFFSFDGVMVGRAVFGRPFAFTPLALWSKAKRERDADADDGARTPPMEPTDADRKRRRLAYGVPHTHAFGGVSDVLWNPPMSAAAIALPSSGASGARIVAHDPAAAAAKVAEAHSKDPTVATSAWRPRIEYVTVPPCVARISMQRSLEKLATGTVTKTRKQREAEAAAASGDAAPADGAEGVAAAAPGGDGEVVFEGGDACCHAPEVDPAGFDAAAAAATAALSAGPTVGAPAADAAAAPPTPGVVAATDSLSPACAEDAACCVPPPEPSATLRETYVALMEYARMYEDDWRDVPGKQRKFHLAARHFRSLALGGAHATRLRTMLSNVSNADAVKAAMTTFVDAQGGNAAVLGAVATAATTSTAPAAAAAVAAAGDGVVGATAADAAAATTPPADDTTAAV